MRGLTWGMLVPLQFLWASPKMPFLFGNHKSPFCSWISMSVCTHEQELQALPCHNFGNQESRSWSAWRCCFNCSLSSFPCRALSCCQIAVISSSVKYFLFKKEKRMVLILALYGLGIMKQPLILGCRWLVVWSHLETVSSAMILVTYRRDGLDQQAITKWSSWSPSFH